MILAGSLPTDFLLGSKPRASGDDPNIKTAFDNMKT